MTKPAKKSNSDLIFELLKDPDRKPILRMIAEVFYLFCIYRDFPSLYFSRYLFKKGTTNIKDYLPNKFYFEQIQPFFNNKEVREVLENKLFFDFFYSQYNISLPKILMYNHKKMFVVGKKSIAVNNAFDFKVLLEEIFKQNTSYDSILIKKTYWSYGGDKIYKLLLNQFRTDPKMINELYSEVTRSAFLFQETVKQHPDLNILNPSCLNTIRFDTFIDSDGNIDIVSGYIRMSINNLFVDNISSGGCRVGIDLKTGKLKKNGYSSIRILGKEVLKEHPVTKTIFENFSIPFFPQAKELVIRTASFMPELRLIGWDVAIGESGPVLIEGNSNYNMSGNDLTDGGYRANAVFRKALHEFYNS